MEKACEWDSNPRLQDGRRGQIRWAMAAPSDVKPNSKFPDN